MLETDFNSKADSNRTSPFMNIPSSLHLHLNSSHHFTEIRLLSTTVVIFTWISVTTLLNIRRARWSLVHWNMWLLKKKVITDLGASSTTFWFLLWIEHSLSFSHRALPCLSASTYKRIKENNSGIGIRIGHKTEVHLKNMASMVDYMVVTIPLKSTRTNVKPSKQINENIPLRSKGIWREWKKLRQEKSIRSIYIYLHHGLWESQW